MSLFRLWWLVIALLAIGVTVSPLTLRMSDPGAGPARSVRSAGDGHAGHPASAFGAPADRCDRDADVADLEDEKDFEDGLDGEHVSAAVHGLPQLVEHGSSTRVWAHRVLAGARRARGPPRV